MPALGDAGATWLARRGIRPETAERLGIFTGSESSGAVLPDPFGKVIVFPFIEHGEVIGEKYRARGKRFWQKAGAKKRIFWNADALDHPGLEDGSVPLIITEGEGDCLTAIDCGWPAAVSVPDGAPQQASSDPADDSHGKFAFLWNARDRLKHIKRFILAVDNDEPGKALEAELLRRLSPARCSFVEYPPDCKDLNDIRMKHGAEAVTRCLTNVKPYPVRGLYNLDDYPDVEAPETFSTGWASLDPHLKLWPGELFVISGVPGFGKSSWLLHLSVNLADMYGWRIALASYEIPTVPILRHKLRLIVTGKPASSWEEEDWRSADRFIADRFVFIDDDPSGEEIGEPMTLEWLIDRAEEAVMRYGVNMLAIDPWNEIEHSRPRTENETEYHNRALRMLRRLAQRRKIVVAIVAHPTKEFVKEKRAPTLYDISGSSAWINKPDHGIIIDWPDPERHVTEIHINKVRFNWSGRKGKVKLHFDPGTERYSDIAGSNDDREAMF